LAARYQRTKKFDAPHSHLVAACQEALTRCRFRVVKIDNETATMTARTGINLVSLGEDLTIRIFADGAISVASESSFAYQFVDLGKNRRNAELFLDEVATIIEDRDPDLHAKENKRLMDA
jgi:hypothetical protein